MDPNFTAGSWLLKAALLDDDVTPPESMLSPAHKEPTASGKRLQGFFSACLSPCRTVGVFPTAKPLVQEFPACDSAADAQSCQAPLCGWIQRHEWLRRTGSRR